MRALLALLAVAALAQNAPDASRFEVASMKKVPAPSGVPTGPPIRGGPGTADPERMTIRITLRGLLVRAYGLPYFQISGPSWIDSDTFQIDAKVAPGSTPAQANAMLQNLLTERLALAVHHETRTLEIYRLTVDPRGAKLKPPAAGESTAPAIVPDKTGFLPVPRSQSIVANAAGGCMRISGHGATVAGLIAFLQGQLDYPLVDQTGLDGQYDIRLEFAKTSPAGAECDTGATIFSALRDQLGLLLRNEKVPMDVLVVDHADREPRPN